MLDRLALPGPKRILALDGGGIRGALAIGYLARIEELLRERHHDPDLRLRDYFDLIAGTSTGSLIAAGLIVGMSASDIAATYREMGPRVFGGKRRLIGRTKALFDGSALEAILAEQLGDVALGDEALTTGLCIVVKRADTRSVWPLHNHPQGRFYEANRNILLRTAVRASTAAPFYFTPESFDVGAGGGRGAFIDGSISTANNPALLAFLVATLQGFPFRWQTGRDDMLLVSIGSGSWSKAQEPDRVLDHRLWDWAVEVPTMLMEDAVGQADLLLRYFGWTPSPEEVDLEMGTLEDDFIAGEPLLTYVRYAAPLDEVGLEGVGLAALIPRLDSLRQTAAGHNVTDLLEIGRRSASRDVTAGGFPPAFDLRP